MPTRRDFLKCSALPGAALLASGFVPDLFAQDDAAPKPEDAKLFAISYGDQIHRKKTPPRKIKIPKVGEYLVLKGDFHTHTIFSDGWVMPQRRISEAVNFGLDVISITDHIEGDTNRIGKKDDRDAAYKLAKPEADKRKILLVRGGEITRSTMGPGHLNALFLQDTNALAAVSKDWRQMVAVAVEQGAFIQWNHPGWVSNGGGLKKGQPMQFFPEHEEIWKKGHLHGIEVFANSACLHHPIAHDWCNEKDLAVMVNTDLHPCAYERFGFEYAGRPMTLVLARERTLESVREALFAKRTLGWAANMVFGRDPWLDKLFRSCVKIDPSGAGVSLQNLSDIPCVVEANGKTSELPPQGSVDMAPTKKLTVTNWFVGAFKPLVVEI